MIVKFLVNAAARDLLAKHRIMAKGAETWPLGAALNIDTDAVLEPYSHVLSGLIVPKSIGAFSYLFSPADAYMNIGRYCSIARKVVLMGSSHPDDWVSSHPFSHNPGPVQGVKTYLRDIGAQHFYLAEYARPDPYVYIGHDVWIGDDAMIKRGVTIGHGAIVGARSVVTKDVPPYAIVGGSPARIIRYRFDEALVERLLASQWWRYGPDVVQALGVTDPARFVDRLAEQEARGLIKPLDLEPLTGAALVAASKLS